MQGGSEAEVRSDLKRTVLEIAGLVWERRLSDTAGGNISIRDRDIVCITPGLMGYRRRWQITAEDLSVINLAGEVLEGPEKVTREAAMHLGLYNEFSDANAVIHAHPYWSMVFVARSLPIMPTLQSTVKFGRIDCVPEAPACSQELADNVVANFKSRVEQWEKTALEAALPRHGVVAMGRDMNACFDIIDRIETECRCQILGKLLDS